MKDFPTPDNHILREEIPVLLGMLKGLPQKTPLALEISKAMKSLEVLYREFEALKLEIMRKYLVISTEGNFVAKLDIKDPSNLTIFDLQVEEGLDTQFIKEISELSSSRVQIQTHSVNIDEKTIYLQSGDKVKLRDIISNYFGSGELYLLERLRIITDTHN